MPNPLTQIKILFWFWQISIILSWKHRWCHWMMLLYRLSRALPKTKFRIFWWQWPELFLHEYMICSKDTFPVTPEARPKENIFIFHCREGLADSVEICKLQERASYGQFSRDSPSTVTECQTKNYWRHSVRLDVSLSLLVKISHNNRSWKSFWRKDGKQGRLSPCREQREFL